MMIIFSFLPGRLSNFFNKLIKYLLSTYYVSGHMLGTKEKTKVRIAFVLKKNIVSLFLKLLVSNDQLTNIGNI